MIQNLLKGGNQNTKTPETTQETAAPQEVTSISPLLIFPNNFQETELPVQKPETTQTEQQAAPVQSKTDNDFFSSSQSHRRYLTPQLTPELSSFSGLSLRLEEAKNTTQSNHKGERLPNFPLAKPLVIGVCDIFLMWC